MYAPVAAIEPQRPDLQRGASATPDVVHERKRSLKQLPPAADAAAATASSRRATIKRTALVVAGIALVAATVVAALHFVKSDAFDTLIQWLQDHELVGSAIYFASFVFFIVVCFPSTGFELFAGYIFGFWLGLALATAGKLTGSVLSFFLGRYVCRERVQRYLDERAHPAFRAFQSLLEKRQVLVVFLTRTAFFPIAIKNYGLSALGVDLSVYVAAAIVTGLPFSLVWVYSGHAAQHVTLLLSNPESHGSTEIVFLIVGAVSALALLAVVGWYTRKYVLDMAEKEREDAGSVSASPTPTHAAEPEATADVAAAVV